MSDDGQCRKFVVMLVRRRKNKNKIKTKMSGSLDCNGEGKVTLTSAGCTNSSLILLVLKKIKYFS